MGRRDYRRTLNAAYLCAFAFLLATGCGTGRTAPPRAQAAAEEPAPRAPHKYAVLVNADTGSHHKRNISRAYRTLRTLGFAPADLFVLSPRDRRNPPANGTPVFKPFPEHFARVMDDLAARVEPGDLVVLYGTGHGDTDDGESLLELRNGELWADDLREKVDRLRANTVVIMDQCFSGGFIDAFEGTKSKALVIATVDRDHMTYCVPFARAFWDAFLHPEQADRNHDGKTSIREAFDVAVKAHRKDLDGDPELRATAACRAFNGFDDALLN